MGSTVLGVGICYEGLIKIFGHSNSALGSLG